MTETERERRGAETEGGGTEVGGSVSGDRQ